MSNILDIIEESGSVLDDREIEIIQNKTQRKKRQKKKKRTDHHCAVWQF